MSLFKTSRLPLFLILAALGCTTSRPLDSPYATCNQGDGCDQGTGCLATTLPASAGFTGSFCTTSCSSSANCLQDLSNYSAICVNAQCYIQCPTGSSTCPYGTACLTFSDQNGNNVNLCTP